MNHFIVPPGQEEAVLKLLAGPTYQLEPVCPLCGHQGAERVIETPKGDVVIPCYLDWCAAHGVHAPIREGLRLPPSRTGEKGGTMIRCSSCHYWTHPSAFCRPTGPAH